jgi:hypothetical protein
MRSLCSGTKQVRLTLRAVGATVVTMAVTSCADALDTRFGSNAGDFGDGSVSSHDADNADAFPTGDDADSSADDSSEDAAAEAGSDVVDASSGIVFHGESLQVLSANGLVFPQPANTAVGDVLLAALLFGNISGPGSASVTPPNDGKWTELGQASALPDKAAVFVFWAVNDGSLNWPEQWGVSAGDAGVGWLRAYGGVDPSMPTNFAADQSLSPDNGASWPSPLLPNGATVGQVTVVTFGGFSWNGDGGPAPTQWSLPAQWANVNNQSDGLRRSEVVGEKVATQSTTTVQVTAQASGPFFPQYATAAIVGLKPM